MGCGEKGGGARRSVGQSSSHHIIRPVHCQHNRHTFSRTRDIGEPGLVFFAPELLSPSISAWMEVRSMYGLAESQRHGRSAGALLSAWPFFRGERHDNKSARWLLELSGDAGGGQKTGGDGRRRPQKTMEIRER
ncbi:uncharacterized protein CIMG_13260 [Coccidioides immitis RS]|uniref:Uncharacterized protein n=1 Tax=Coccidioides immitis (strain RS) TaxID=246410 RepID=A0A0D8JU00_COCIM|nr:uncharacterized protein CIMG_13260 [Coccidioides immitis RS]KJF60825.1 hypothetical protein CIMG_13260 [Coccidioides immitis RS]